MHGTIDTANILERPGPDRAAALDPAFGQRFLVTVDTEEEFDWSAPVSREAQAVTAAGHIADFQTFCEARGIVPLWLVDWPIANSPVAAEILRPAAASGKAEIGLHLHPWVNPPFDEDVSQFTSFAGNLPPVLEREKFVRLHQAIEHNLGVCPTVYRAGRYGAGPATARLLREMGYAIDSSVRAHFDYSGDDGGPDYHAHPLVPYWLDSQEMLLELPVTTVFTGALHRLGPNLLPLAAKVPKLPGLLARPRLLERIALTPEGIPIADAVRAVDAAVAQDIPVLVFSFHSPSLGVGHTPYVRCEADLAQFYDWWSTMFDHLATRGVAPAGIADVLRAAHLA